MFCAGVELDIDETATEFSTAGGVTPAGSGAPPGWEDGTEGMATGRGGIEFVPIDGGSGGGC